MTQLVRKETHWTGGDTSPTYRVKIRLGCNWDEHLLKSYNPSDFASENTDDETPRLVELDGNTPISVTIGTHIYPVTTTS